MNNAAEVLDVESAPVDNMRLRIRERVEELKLKGVTQMGIAAKGGFSQAALQSWMTGTRKMPRNLRGLARGLECSVGWLITGRDSPSAYEDVQLVATALEAIEKLPLSYEEKARIFIKVIAAASAQPSASDADQGGNAPSDSEPGRGKSNS